MELARAKRLICLTPRRGSGIRWTPGFQDKVNPAARGSETDRGDVPSMSPREACDGNGHAAHRQAAADRLHAEGQRPAPDRRQPADAPAARPHASAGDEGPRAARHRGADEEHHARALPAGAAGSGRDRLRLRLRRDGPVPRGHLQAARQHRPGAAADPQRVPHLRAARPAGGHRSS